MAFKKTLASEAQIVIMGGNTRKKYPIGFEYMANGHYYKVIDTFFQDNTEWRRLRSDDGNIEDVTTYTIDEDLKEHGSTVVKQGESLYVTGQSEAKVINDPSKPKAEPEAVEAQPKEIPAPKAKPKAKKKAVKPKAKKTTKPKRRR